MTTLTYHYPTLPYNYPILPVNFLPYPYHYPCLPLPYSTLQLPYPTRKLPSPTPTTTLPYPTLPYPTLPLPPTPYPTLPYPSLPYPTLPYPTLLYPSLPYPTLQLHYHTLSYARFQSVFSIRSPLYLAKLCKIAVLDSISLLGNKVPESLSGKYPIMPDIEFSDNGVAKLLSNLIIAKTAGSRCHKTCCLRELSHIIASAVAAIISKIHRRRRSMSTFYSNYTDMYPLQDDGAYHGFQPYQTFDRHNILYDIKHGFRERRSCENPTGTKPH